MKLSRDGHAAVCCVFFCSGLLRWGKICVGCHYSTHFQTVMSGMFLVVMTRTQPPFVKHSMEFRQTKTAACRLAKSSSESNAREWWESVHVFGSRLSEPDCSFWVRFVPVSQGIKCDITAGRLMLLLNRVWHKN